VYLLIGKRKPNNGTPYCTEITYNVTYYVQADEIRLP